MIMAAMMVMMMMSTRCCSDEDAKESLEGKEKEVDGGTHSGSDEENSCIDHEGYCEPSKYVVSSIKW
jgi:hypothetical protein